jgi:hypothetical protein
VLVVDYSEANGEVFVEPLNLEEGLEETPEEEEEPAEKSTARLS